MNSKIAAVVTALGALLTASAFAKEPQTIYRDSEFKFRLKYPDKWITLKPVGQNVRLSIKSPEGRPPATCNVVVRSMSESASMSQAQIDAEINEKTLTTDEAKALIIGTLRNAQLIESKRSKINNIPGQFGVIERSNETLDSKIFSREMKFVTFTPGYVWHLMCGSPGTSPVYAKQAYKQWEPTFRGLFDSFTLEPWR